MFWTRVTLNNIFVLFIDKSSFLNNNTQTSCPVATSCQINPVHLAITHAPPRFLWITAVTRRTATSATVIALASVVTSGPAITRTSVAGAVSGCTLRRWNGSDNHQKRQNQNKCRFFNWGHLFWNKIGIICLTIWWLPFSSIFFKNNYLGFQGGQGKRLLLKLYLKSLKLEQASDLPKHAVNLHAKNDNFQHM